MSTAAVLVKNADRMMNAIKPVPEGIELSFADGCSGVIPFADIPEISGLGGAIPLTATSHTDTEITWEWETLPEPAITYSFYSGTIASIHAGIYDHAVIDVAQCGIAGNTTTVADVANGVDSYYLVAGNKNGNDGPFGFSRPKADPRCP